jgi:hypothetical protein
MSRCEYSKETRMTLRGSVMAESEGIIGLGMTNEIGITVGIDSRPVTLDLREKDLQIKNPIRLG